MTFYKFALSGAMSDTGSSPESMSCMPQSSAMVSPFTYFSSISSALSTELSIIINLVVVLGLSIISIISLVSLLIIVA